MYARFRIAVETSHEKMIGGLLDKENLAKGNTFEKSTLENLFVGALTGVKQYRHIW